MTRPRRKPVTTMFGVPVPVLLKDPRLLTLMRTILRERGGDPDSWTMLSLKEITRLRERQEAAKLRLVIPKP